MSRISQINSEILDSYNEVCKLLDTTLSKNAQQNEKKFYSDLLPMFYNDFNKTNEKILFVGINPSFSLKMYSGFDMDLFKYSLFEDKNIDTKISLIEELIKIQEGLMYGKYNNINQIQYFKHLDSFAQKVGFKDSWAHFDLFPNRCTDQKLFTNAITQNEFNNYKQKCISRFNKIISNTNFRAVFIFNKASSSFIRDNLLDLKFSVSYEEFRDPIYGLYYLNKTPFILFKQLSYGATSNKELEKFIDITNAFLNR